MSNYKDFSDYNEAAQDIRPTARIQLIQRIINAASIISNLASGVPLKWANAYKSFQVLVPNEQGAPTDYTTAEAVSSVDSVLYEAESQLRASKDDMDTLKTELTNIGLSGDIHLQQMQKFPLSYGYVALNTLRINSANYYIFIKALPNGILDWSNLYICNQSHWDRLSGTTSFTVGNTLYFTRINDANDIDTFVLVNSPNNAIDPNSTRLIALNYRRIGYTKANIYVRDYSNVEVHLYDKWNIDITSITLPVDDEELQLQPSPISQANYQVGGQMFDSIPFTADLDNIDEALGLPDPTELIQILDNME